MWLQELQKKKAQEKKLYEARLGIMEQQQRMAQVRWLALCPYSLTTNDAIEFLTCTILPDLCYCDCYRCHPFSDTAAISRQG